MMCVFRSFSLGAFAGLALATYFIVGCSQDVSGPVQVQLMQPTGLHCGYTIAPATLHTLQNLISLHGSVGRVVYLDENVDARPEILDNGAGFQSIDVSFSNHGGIYHALDYSTLFSVSLYYAVERGYTLFSSWDADIPRLAAQWRFNETLIVHEGRRTLGDVGVDGEVTDNGEYRPHKVQRPDGGFDIRNYIFSYPTLEVTDLPLGLNMGIMVHEYAHMIFNFLFEEPRRAMGSSYDTRATVMTIRSIDEGLSDYFGYLATGDPGYFLCTFPTENRDVSVPKFWSDSTMLQLKSDRQFDPHVGGAVFASVQYQIGQSIAGGHLANARSLLQMVRQLTLCANTNQGSFRMDFPAVAQCHLSALGAGESQSVARGIYERSGLLYSGAP